MLGRPDWKRVTCCCSAGGASRSGALTAMRSCVEVLSNRCEQEELLVPVAAQQAAREADQHAQRTAQQQGEQCCKQVEKGLRGARRLQGRVFARRMRAQTMHEWNVVPRKMEAANGALLLHLLIAKPCARR